MIYIPTQTSVCVRTFVLNNECSDSEISLARITLLSRRLVGRNERIFRALSVFRVNIIISYLSGHEKRLQYGLIFVDCDSCAGKIRVMYTNDYEKIVLRTGRTNDYNPAVARRK